MDRDRYEESGDYSPAERETSARLFEERYDTLAAIARANRRRARLSDTMCTTDLLHECYLKLYDHPSWRSREHFLRAAALAMRCVIVDHARKRLAQKRGGGAERVALEESETLLPEYAETPEQILAIAELLEDLEKANPRWMRVVDARYFSGMTEAETALVLRLSERTVRRAWKDARAWIAERMGVEP